MESIAWTLLTGFLDGKPVLGLLFLAILVLLRPLYLFVVPQGHAGLLLRRGRVTRADLVPGWYFKIPIFDVGYSISIGLMQFTFSESTRTKNNNFVTIKGAAQFRVIPAKIVEALFRISDPDKIIAARILSALRSAVAVRTAEECFEHKDAVETDVSQHVSVGLAELGFELMAVPITEVAPDEAIVKATNAINLAERKVTEETANAKAILVRAEAQALAGASSSRILAQGRADAFAFEAEGILRMLRTLAGNPSLTIPWSAAALFVLRLEALKMRAEFARSGKSSSVVLPDDDKIIEELHSLLPTLIAHEDVNQKPESLDELEAQILVAAPDVREALATFKEQVLDQANNLDLFDSDEVTDKLINQHFPEKVRGLVRRMRNLLERSPKTADSL